MLRLAMVTSFSNAFYQVYELSMQFETNWPKQGKQPLEHMVGSIKSVILHATDFLH